MPGKLTARVAGEQTYHLVDGVYEEGDDIAERPRTAQRVAVVHDAPLQTVESLAEDEPRHRSDNKVLYGRNLHERLYAVLPEEGGYGGAIEERAEGVEAQTACAHVIGGSGVRMEHVVEYELVAVEPRTFPHVIAPTLEEGHPAQLFLVPCRGVLGQKLEHTESRHAPCEQHARVEPHALIVGTARA